MLGAVVPAYNVSGVSGEIKFTPDVLAGIFLGKITNWNDKGIASANPGVNFPKDEPIVVIHRSDGSGTTFIFTDYLSKVSSDWQSQAGKGTSVKWPVGLGGKGNEGVAGMIRGAGEAIFAVGRTAGWLAHALEEYERNIPIRPRGIYTGRVAAT